MKKYETLINLILVVMKISSLQIFVMSLACGVAIGSPSEIRGQSVLDERVTLSANNQEIQDVLSHIERTINVKFTYNPKSIPIRTKVSFDYSDKSLNEILEGIFSPMNVTYRVSGDYIVLKKGTSATGMGDSPEPYTAFTVSGTVKDDQGAPLPGVIVVLKQTTIGTTTDADGKYSLTVAEGTETLVFTFIGFEAQEIDIESRSIIDVTMVADVKSLQEIVVIGYGTAEKKEITSSVASVSSKDFNKGNVYDASQFLQGKVAGLSIVKPGADPNAGFALRLRGLSTFGANSSPLIIIDGVLGGSLQTLDPNEIASIDVLKDGSAAAIYGSRGSSGVIIITTKKGKDIGGIEYNSYVSFEDLAKTVDIATAERFREEGGPDLGTTTDWVDQVTRAGMSQSHNFAFFGGAGQSNYRLAVSYRDVEGIAIGSGFDQINTRLSLNHSALDDRLNLSSTIGVTVRNATFVPYEVMRFALISNPTAPVYINGDPEQGYFEPNTTEFHNPIAIMNETTDDGTFKTLLTTLKADYEILDGLIVSGFYSMQYESDVRSQYFGSKMRFAGSAGLKGRATKFTEDRNNQLLEFTGSFNRSLDKLGLNLVGGYSYQKFIQENFNVFNTGFITDELLYNNLGLGLGLNSDNTQLRGFGSSKGESLLVSFFGRLMLNYDEKYFLTTAYRREGSSRFGQNNRWGNFYSISGGADIAKVFDLSLFSTLKVRAGYGLTGNLPVPFYAYRSRLNGSGQIRFNDGSADRLIRLYDYVSNENPDLKWEQKGELNFGLDFGLFGSRLYGSVDYYVRNSKDILFNQPVSQPPNFFGFTLLNLGELESRGTEVVINYNMLNKEDFSYTTGITFAHNKTKIISLNEDSQVFFGGNLGPPGLNGQLSIKAQVGEELGLIIAPRYLGLNEDGSPNVEPLGDENGDGVVGQAFVDWPAAGNALPDFELGWNNNIAYKSLDLSFTMRGAFGHSLVNVNRAYYEVPENRSNYNLVVTKYYRPELTGNERFYDYFVEDASYFKLDNIALGYNLRFNNSPFKTLRLYVSGQNLFVITDYTGVDPEVHYGNDPLFPGVEDRNSYFRSKTYTFGVNIGL